MEHISGNAGQWFISKSPICEDSVPCLETGPRLPTPGTARPVTLFSKTHGTHLCPRRALSLCPSQRGKSLEEGIQHFIKSFGHPLQCTPHPHSIKSYSQRDVAAVAGLAVSFTVLIVSVNKLFIFVCLEYSHPFAIYCVKNKTKSKTYPHPIPPHPLLLEL